MSSKRLILKLFFLLFLVNLLTTLSYSQDSSYLSKVLHDEDYCADQKLTNNKSTYTNKQVISTYTMNRFIRKDLTLLTFNEAGLPSIGNYATLDYKENKSRVNLNISYYNPFSKRGDTVPIKSILSINVDAGLNEGISALFTNKSLNSKAGVTGKLSILSRRTRYFQTDAIDCNTIKLMRERLLTGFQQEQELFNLRTTRLDWDNTNDCDSAITKSKKFRQEIDSARTAMKNVKTKEDSCKTVKILEKKLVDYRDHINTTRKIADDNRIYEPANVDIVKKYWKNKVQLYLDSMVAIESSLVKFEKFTIQWWDIDGSGNGEKYNLLNVTLPIDSQISKKNFTQWSGQGRRIKNQ